MTTLVRRPQLRPAALRDRALRERVLAGDIFCEPRFEAADQLCTVARSIIARAFSMHEEDSLPNDASGAEWLTNLTRARQEFAVNSEAKSLLAKCISHWNGSEKNFIIDRPRIRANQPGLATIAAAAPALYAHRDTWYANPQSQINAWMALSPAPAATGFAIYDTVFDSAVLNDSAEFHFEDFRRNVGWQRVSPPSGASYPRALMQEVEKLPCTLIEPNAREVVLFSAAHLHQTMAHNSPQIRWSVDFRWLERGDIARGLRAPNCDNASTGDASSEYSRW